MAVRDIALNALDGSPGRLDAIGGKVALVVNVASKCGLTPQYSALQRLQERFEDQGFTVLGVPCNQFMGQEPGTAEEIAEFCSTNYSVTFPIAEKVDVNGAKRHPLYAALTPKADAEGHTGDVRWNFEKFLVDRAGEVIDRFPPQLDPESPEVVEAIERALQ